MEVGTVDGHAPAAPVARGWRESLEAVVRTLSAASAAGALLGLLVGGVGGRLAMALLAVRNPEDSGRLTDDGFSIGQFTLGGTLNLLGASLQAGLTGAAIYLAVRHLALGPAPVRIASLTAGGTVVVGGFLVHPGGRDFRLLEPDWLPVALFLAVPAVFVPLLALLVERWLAPGSWFATAAFGRVAAVLGVWALAGYLVPLLLVGMVVGLLWHQVAPTVRRRTARVLAWVGRALLGALGIWALTVLVDSIRAVT